MTSNQKLLHDLAKWMSEKEDEVQEFKEAKQNYSFDDLAKYCCAIANEGGGRVILGVSNNRPREVVGSQAFPQLERTRLGLCDKLKLAINFDEVLHPNGRVVVFHIPGRPIGMAVKYDGRYWGRYADELRVLSEERLREIFAESGEDFSASVCEGLRLEDLDTSAIENARSLWIARSRSSGDLNLANRLLALSVRELLIDLEVLAGNDLNYAALILFGSRSAVKSRLAQSEIIFEFRSSNASGMAQVRKEFSQGFFAYYDQLWNDIDLRNDKQEFQEGFFIHPIATFSERVVREAILNAVSHRNYQLGGSIFVRQFHRRLEIDSPGSLPLGITLENIIERQNPRNRRIAEVFQRCGLVERSGQGMNLIYEESIKEGKPVPDFARTDSFQVGITLFGNIMNPQFVKFIEKIGSERAAMFSTKDWLTLNAIGNDQKLSDALFERTAKLEELGMIEKIRGRKFVLSKKYYDYVGKKAAYTRKRGLGRDQNLALLLQHIRENAKDGSKLQELCEVVPALQVSYVRSLLRALQRQGVIYPKGRTNAARWFPKIGNN